MKRMTLIAAALCLIMLATVGAGAVAAKQPPSSDKVKQFDVKFGDTVKGKLTVNLNNWRYILNVRGLSPGTTYWLGSEARSSKIVSVTANPGGEVHMGGVLNPEYVRTAALASFYLGTGTLPSTLDEAPGFDAKKCVISSGVTEVYGTLKTADGAPLANEEITIFWYFGGESDLWKTVTTKEDGSFCAKFTTDRAYWAEWMDTNQLWPYDVYVSTYDMQVTPTCPAGTCLA